MKRMILMITLMLPLTMMAGHQTFRLDGSRILVDGNDHKVVRLASEHFSNDMELVSGKRLQIQSGPQYKASSALIFGTIGKSEIIDRLISAGKMDVNPILGKWECYQMQIVDNPVKGVGRALVVVGSDRRGTAYGIFELSRRIGVSPWYWWAEAPVKKNPRPCVQLDSVVISKEPSVKYRGVFINDEDWGLLRWARVTLDKDLNNIGPRTYEKVCELLLRLKANLLHPAMHEASLAFYQNKENMKVADDYAIVMGSTHCDPLLFNNANEWNQKVDGPWNYDTNAEGVDKRLRERVREAKDCENVYTLALRGLHDRSMQGSSLMTDRLATLDRALKSQRNILTEELGRKADDIPQIFIPYKEVLDVYDHGLELPDDVTLVWPDDNYGYIKRMSNLNEQKRSGRSGVYYHVSYLGKPHQYLWLDTTSPVLMYEELKKLYDTGGDRLWVLNVGDIKSCEFGMDLFLSMAYDIDGFSYDNVWTYRAGMLSELFGAQYYERFLDITRTFYDLAFERKPEYMGWGYDWNNGNERCSDTEFSWHNYSEAQRRLDEYDRIAADARAIYEELPSESKDGFLHMLYYPVNAASLMNKIHLLAQKCREYAKVGRFSANALARDVKMYRDSVQAITMAYDMVKNGKWVHVMGMNQCGVSDYFNYPKLGRVEYGGGPVWGISTSGQGTLEGMGIHNSLPCFNSYSPCSHSFDIYSRDGNPIVWEVISKPDWVNLESKEDGYGDITVVVSLNWDKAPSDRNFIGEITMKIAGEDTKVLLSAFNPEIPSEIISRKMFVETDGYVSIDAASFSRSRENDDIKFSVIENIGCEGRSVLFGNPLSKRQNASRKAPCLEYDFYCFNRGLVDVYTYVLPTFPLYENSSFSGHESASSGTMYGVMIDEGHIITPDFSSIEYAYDWYTSVLRNSSVKKSTLYVDKPGHHVIRVNCGTPGMVLQKIVIDFGGLKRSYMGPEPARL